MVQHAFCKLPEQASMVQLGPARVLRRAAGSTDTFDPCGLCSKQRRMAEWFVQRATAPRE